MQNFKDFDLTNYNSYKIKAKCKEAILPDSMEDIIKIYSENYDDLVLIGTGHNILLTKEYYDQRFLIFNGNYSKINVEGNIITAEAGCTMLKLSELAHELSLSGLEIFYDIPSSLGGAVVMNAGASGEEIKDLIVKVTYLDLEDMQVKTIDREDINFQYRNSFFQRKKNKIILETVLELEPGDKDAIKQKMDLIKSQRWAKQPRTYPNAGSVFKRPPGYFVGKLTQDLGLKGHTVGGAMLSKKHGGFIINFDNATGQDILEIIQHVQKTVFEAHGVNMEIEQRII